MQDRKDASGRLCDKISRLISCRIRGESAQAIADVTFAAPIVVEVDQTSNGGYYIRTGPFEATVRGIDPADCADSFFGKLGLWAVSL